MVSGRRSVVGSSDWPGT